MPFVRTLTPDALEVPSLGLAVAPGESVEIDDAAAQALEGHPLLRVTQTRPSAAAGVEPSVVVDPATAPAAVVDVASAPPVISNPTVAAPAVSAS